MASPRTEVTEIVTGLGMTGYKDLDEVLAMRPRVVEHVSDEHFLRLRSLREEQRFAEQFELAWQNGKAFAQSNEGLRGRPPWLVEWKGDHKPPGYEQIPADLRVDHVYLISCKYGSKILHNASPSQVFVRHLGERQVDRGRGWFHDVAPCEYQSFYQTVIQELKYLHSSAKATANLGGQAQTDPNLQLLASLPEQVTDLTRDNRKTLKSLLPKRGRLPQQSQQSYERFAKAVSQATAGQWAQSLKTKTKRELLFWRLLRINPAPYFVLGASQDSEPLRYRIGTPWDFRQLFELVSFEVSTEQAKQPYVVWQATVKELSTQKLIHIDGGVEIRWTHGRFSGAPEAKVLLDTHPHHVPGYFQLKD